MKVSGSSKLKGPNAYLLSFELATVVSRRRKQEKEAETLAQAEPGWLRGEVVACRE